MARINEALLLFLLNATWQVTLVALLVSTSDRVLREASSRYRHTLWVAALAACVALTLSFPLHISPATASLPASASVDPDQHPANEVRTANLPLERAEAAGRPVSSGVMLPRMVMPRVALSKPLALTIVVLYGLLLLLRAGMLVKAWGRTRILLNSARRVELSPQVAQALAYCQRVLGLGKISILSSAAVAVPVTAGTIRPVLILPEHLLRDGDADLLTSALGHEAAHIARRDYLLNLVYEFVSLPLWFHPAMRLVLRRIRQTRELRCDEIVTERLLEPRIYAQSLVQLAGAALPFGRPAATITVGIADADILEERIMSILKYSPARTRRRSALLVLAALLFVIPCIAAAPFAVHVAIHQPAMAAATGQASAVAVPSSNQAPAAASESLKLLTPDGEVTVLTDHLPKVGDVLIAGSHRLRITAIDPQGQYRASVLKGGAQTGTLTAEAIAKNGDLYALNQSQDSQVKVRAERKAREKDEAEALTQVRQAREQLERAERAAQEKSEGEASEQVTEARELLARAQRAAQEKHNGELSEQEIQAHRERENAERAARVQRQMELARQAKIPMDQAIQIAQRETPGTVVEARLIGERGTVTYFISILRQNGTESDNAYVLINAVDGSIIQSGERKRER
jgi:beta-lactamase regulating signal transducer with metallopeptidase domain/uncharacterized membrane protein YkoI